MLDPIIAVIVRKSSAELIATYIFVFFRSHSIVAFIAAFHSTLNLSSTLFLAATFNLGISIGVMEMGNMSRGHINPTRSFGPAVLSGILFKGKYYQWIYWVAPIIDGTLGALSYKFMYHEKRKIHYSPEK